MRRNKTFSPSVVAKSSPNTHNIYKTEETSEVSSGLGADRYKECHRLWCSEASLMPEKQTQLPPQTATSALPPAPGLQVKKKKKTEVEDNLQWTIITLWTCEDNPVGLFGTLQTEGNWARTDFRTDFKMLQW
ncbi:hypothetical protein INR49_006930 [Caranx melampygus]|nr:hypothetical protein INR49_006930 [Caranx melampygus]